MNESSGPPRICSNLSVSLNHRLNLYAIAASAAGVSLLALAEPAEAKVVYTQTHQVIRFNGTYNLDLDHNGTVDFLIRQWSSGGINGLFAKEAYGNAVRGYSNNNSKPFASALRAGARIGPGRGFVKSGYYGEAMAYVVDISGTSAFGPWVSVAKRYLGLKFQIDGKTHYGWARLNVQVQGNNITATLTGYAYESIPGKRIRAGQTRNMAETAASPVSTGGQTFKSGGISSDQISGAPQPASLGMLALGAPACRHRRQQL